MAKLRDSMGQKGGEDEDEDIYKDEDEEYCICLKRILYLSYNDIVFVLTGYFICLTGC